jgi:hypothetical protein
VPTPVFNAANQTSGATSASTLTLASFSAAAGSNRFMEVWVGSGGVSPSACTGVTWGGEALTQRGATQTGTYWRFNKWYIKEADFPSGATGDIVATYAGNNGERSICVIVHEDVDQTNPYRNVSATEENDTNTDSPSVAVASNADDVVTAGIFNANLSGGALSIATSVGTERCDTTAIAGGYEIASASTQTGAATATVTWSISFAGTSEVNFISADSLQGATGSSFQSAWARNSNQVIQ